MKVTICDSPVPRTDRPQSKRPPPNIHPAAVSAHVGMIAGCSPETRIVVITYTGMRKVTGLALITLFTKLQYNKLSVGSSRPNHLESPQFTVYLELVASRFHFTGSSNRKSTRLDIVYPLPNI